jgi:hypothetical protein
MQAEIGGADPLNLQSLALASAEERNARHHGSQGRLRLE